MFSMAVRGYWTVRVGAIPSASTGTEVPSLVPRYGLDTILYPPSSGILLTLA